MGVTMIEPSIVELPEDETSSDEGEGSRVEADTSPPTVPPTGPLSSFRRGRAERIAARISRREERQRAETERKKVQEEGRRRVEEEQRKRKEAIPESLIETDLASLRAGRISVTVVKDESTSYGIGLAQVPRKKNLVKIDAIVNEGLLCDSPLREGDILNTVNNEIVTDYRTVMLQLMKMNGRVTIAVETSTQQSNPAVVQAFCRRPTPNTLFGLEFEVVEHSTTRDDPNGTQEIVTLKLLQIRNIDANGFLAHSALKSGDFVLAINGIPCTEMTAEEASAMIIEETTINIVALNPKLAQEHCYPTRVQRWMQRARRTGVGAVGGTMLGLGLIMIPLPFPPPMGEILVVGGVSVLGTEFEAPKRLIHNARNALKNAVESDGNEEVEIDKLKQMESVGNYEDNANERNDGSVEKQPVELRDSFLTVISRHQHDNDHSTMNGNLTDLPTISDCWSESNMNANIDNMYSGQSHDSSLSPSPTKQFFQNVGRNVVLPFLDHVVGDQKDVELSGNDPDTAEKVRKLQKPEYK